MKDDILKLKTYCCICRKEIPPERATRRSVTCDDDCRKVLNKKRRAEVDQRRCRHCHRPSTPEQRLDFQRWRRSEAKEGKAKVGRPTKQTKEPITADTLRDLLGLVSYEVPLKVIRGWTPGQISEAEEYAAKAHLRASDNPIKVPPRPAFLAGFEFHPKVRTGTVVDFAAGRGAKA